MTLPATPPPMRTALRPSRYTRPVDRDRRAAGTRRGARAPGAALWMAFSPTHARALCARTPWVRTIARRLPLQPPSTCAVRRLAEDREVGGEEVGARAGEPGQAVEVGVDLLVVVPHPGDVDPGIGELGGELQLHRDAGLHVDGAAAPEVRLAVDRRSSRVGTLPLIGTVSMWPAIDDALRPAEVGARDDRVAVAVDLEVRQRADGARRSRRRAAVSSPETLGMSQIVRVRSTEVADRSSAGIPRV